MPTAGVLMLFVWIDVLEESLRYYYQVWIQMLRLMDSVCWSEMGTDPQRVRNLDTFFGFGFGFEFSGKTGSGPGSGIYGMVWCI